MKVGKKTAELDRGNIIWLGVAAAFSIGIYLSTSHWAGSFGFPLDDSWIHQTYARNLALRGEWAFEPGVYSAGSTAPLWSALLAIGYLVKLGPLTWTYILGWLLLWAVALQGERFYLRLQHHLTYNKKAGSNRNSSQSFIPWGGFVLVFEWHLVWAGGSGMETLLLTLLVLTVLVWIVAGETR